MEIDAIVQKYNGDWCAFEIKLGTGQIDEAAATLNKFVSIVDIKKIKHFKYLYITAGTGIGYTLQYGIKVISLALLGI